MTAIVARGETAFPEAGDGVVLCFRNSDMKRLEADLGTTWFNEMLDSFLHGTVSIAFMETMVKHGAKKDREPVEITEEVLDTIPVHILGERLMDAACISMKGMRAEEYIKDAYDTVAKMEAEGKDPPSSSPDTTR